MNGSQEKRIWIQHPYDDKGIMSIWSEYILLRNLIGVNITFIMNEVTDWNKKISVKSFVYWDTSDLVGEIYTNLQAGLLTLDNMLHVELYAIIQLNVLKACILWIDISGTGRQCVFILQVSCIKTMNSVRRVINLSCEIELFINIERAIAVTQLIINSLRDILFWDHLCTRTKQCFPRRNSSAFNSRLHIIFCRRNAIIYFSRIRMCIATGI